MLPATNSVFTTPNSMWLVAKKLLQLTKNGLLCETGRPGYAPYT